MSAAAAFTLYGIAAIVAGGVMFWSLLGESETGDVLGATLFGGLFWPILLVSLAGACIYDAVDRLNKRRRLAIETRAAAVKWAREEAP